MTDPSYPQVPPTEPATTPVSPWAPPPPEQVAAESGTTTLIRRGGGKAPKVLGIAVGIVALGAGGAFAVTSLADDETGAASPEEAATRLVEAIAAEDVLGVIDLLPEGERDLLRDLTTSASDEYQRLGLLSESFSLDGFPGVDIRIEDVEVDVEEITEGLVQVFITDGDMSVELDGDELVGSVGDVIETLVDERGGELEVDDVDAASGADELGATFAVVEEDGRWHPSIAFTIAELARQSSFEVLDEPDLDEGVEPEGADSPEAAVQALIDAGIELDAEAAIAVLDPGEARALQVYSQFFLPAGADLPEDLELSVELTRADVEGIGGGASRVVPTGLALRYEADGGSGEIVVEDGCVSVDIQPPEGEGDPIDEEVCAGDEPDEVLPDELSDVQVPEELQELAAAFEPLELGIVTVERDGEHFVSPIRTLGDIILGLTRGLEREDLEEGGAVYDLLSGEFDDEIGEFVEALLDSALGDLEAIDDDVFDDGLFEDDGSDQDCEGVGCGFDDDIDDGSFERFPAGASGPNGELLVFDAVEGVVPENGTATFTAIADADDDFLIGAQTAGDFDATIRVVDAATGQELASNDDFYGTDPEVLVTLTASQVVTVEVSGFAGAGGGFVVYFEPF